MTENQNTGLNSGLSSGGDASVFGTNQLPDVFGIVKTKLQQAASSPDLFSQVFGDKANTAEIQAVRSQWSVGDFSQLPSVQFLAAANMNGADGAYASSTKTVYLSDSLLHAGAAGVLTEELFHWLDDKVGVDTKGDEGELARMLVFGAPMSIAELARIKQEDDRGFITVNGQQVAVEMDAVSASATSLQSAQNIGVLGSATRVFTGSVGGNINDNYLKLQVSTTSQFTVALSGMTRNVNLRLFNEQGSLIQGSANTGTATDTINRTLNAGIYYVNVYRERAGEVVVALPGADVTSYSLNLMAPTSIPVVPPPSSVPVITAPPSTASGTSVGAVPAPFVRVTSPNGGNSVVRGGVANITWQDNIAENVRIDLYKGGSFYRNITTSTPSTGSFNWTVPTDIVPNLASGTPNWVSLGSDYEIRIRSVTNSAIIDSSDAKFSIVGKQSNDLFGTLFVLNQSAVKAGGTVDYSYTVRNDGTDAVGASKVGLYLSSDAKSTTGDVFLGEISVGGLDAKTTSAVFKGTLTLPSQGNLFYKGDKSYFVKAIADYKNVIAETNEANNAGQTLGNDYGAIAVTDTTPFVRVTSPNGGNDVVRGGVANITWQDNIAENVRIDLYKGGSLYRNIVSSTPSTGSFSWLVPSDIVSGLPSSTPNWVSLGSDYQIRVQSVANSAIFDGSDANFSITGKQSNDLFGSSFTIAPTSVNAGSTIQYAYTIRNNGSDPTSLFKVSFYISPDTTFTTSDYLVGEITTSIGARTSKTFDAALNSASFNNYLNLPAVGNSFWSGDKVYYIGAIADSQNVIAETNEGNNSGQVSGNDYSSISITGTTPVTKYDFKFSYNNGSGDYYTGFVYGTSGAYYTGKTINAGLGQYQILNESNSGTSADVGKVFLTTYYDADSSKASYTPNSYLQTQPSGTKGLSSEGDYVYSNGNVWAFSASVEADVPNSGSTTIITQPPANSSGGTSLNAQVASQILPYYSELSAAQQNKLGNSLSPNATNTNGSWRQDFQNGVIIAWSGSTPTVYFNDGTKYDLPNSLIQALPIVGTLTTSGNISGNLSSSDARDQSRATFYDDYALSGFSSGQQVRLTLTASGFTPQIFLVDAVSGQTQQQSTVIQNGNQTILDFVVPTTGNYRVRVTSGNANQTGSYTLASGSIPVTPLAPSGSTGSIGNPTTSNPASSGSSLTGTVISMGSNLNIRASDTATSSIVGNLAPSSSVTFDGWANGGSYTDINGKTSNLWYRIAGTSNWVAGAYITGISTANLPQLSTPTNPTNPSGGTVSNPIGGSTPSKPIGGGTTTGGSGIASGDTSNPAGSAGIGNTTSKGFQSVLDGIENIYSKAVASISAFSSINSISGSKISIQVEEDPSLKARNQQLQEIDKQLENWFLDLNTRNALNTQRIILERARDEIIWQLGNDGKFGVNLSQFGLSKPIEAVDDTWIVIHGWNDSPQGWGMNNLSQAVQNYSIAKPKQVLVVDWSEGSKTGDDSFPNPLRLAHAAGRIESVADAVVKLLEKAGLIGKKINFIGHSLGAYVSAEISERLTKLNAKPEQLILLDPANNFTLNTVGKSYNPNVDYKNVSKFSRAFYGSAAGDTASNANESFKIEYNWQVSNPGARHGDVVTLFANFLQRPQGGVSRYFGLEDSKTLDFVKHGPNWDWSGQWRGIDGTIKADWTSDGWIYPKEFYFKSSKTDKDETWYENT